MAKDEEEDIPTRKDGMNKRKEGEEGHGGQVKNTSPTAGTRPKD